MAEVGIRELKNRLSSLLDRVEAGEVVTVTRRGTPVAHVIPAGTPSPLAALISEGRLRWSGRKPAALPNPTPLRGRGRTAVEYVIEGRR